MSTRVHYKRPNGTRGTADLDECESWPLVRMTLEAPGLGSLAYEDLDRTRNPPALYRTPRGEFFRRLLWHERPERLRPEAQYYAGATEEEALAWLAGQGYDAPGPPKDDEPAVDEALAATLRILAANPRGRRIVEYLAAREDRQAHLDELATAVFGARAAEALSLRNQVRTAVWRAGKPLRLKGSPLRLLVANNVVVLAAEHA